MNARELVKDGPIKVLRLPQVCDLTGLCRSTIYQMEADLRELLGFQNRRGRDRCRQVQTLLKRKLGDVDRQLKQLTEFRETLENYLAQCARTLGRGTEEECPVVRELSDDRPRSMSAFVTRCE